MRFATPKNTLKEKVGSGGIPEERIKRAEEVIEKCDVGFSSYIHKSVEVMCDIIATEHTDDLSETKRQLLIKEVMTMKAHGKMFSFPLVSALSNEVLQIFDIAQRVNADLIDIIKVYIYKAYSLSRITKFKVIAMKQGKVLPKRYAQPADAMFKNTDKYAYAALLTSCNLAKISSLFG